MPAYFPEMMQFFKICLLSQHELLSRASVRHPKPVNSNSHAIQLSQNNFDDILKSHELVFINFYADWCRFSQMLAPVFEQTAEKVAKEFPGKGKVALGKVDCDTENAIAAKYHVSKYPTLKIVRFGEGVKKEYRGQRSADAFMTFLKEQLADHIKVETHIDNLQNLDRKKRNIIAYLESADNDNGHTYKKLASMLRDDCEFHAIYGEAAADQRHGGDKIVFRQLEENSEDITFPGHLDNFATLHAWAAEKCVPLVREITFENAEELTEEGIPFLILFHHPDDKETPAKYNKIISKELIMEKSGINMLTADGIKFSHPLHHLGKSVKDLPLLAIDSFRHMYLWPHNVKEDIDKPGLLKTFVDDLHSGKLHREFHHGPDPTTTQAPAEHEDKNEDNADAQQHIPKDKVLEEETKPKDPTTPPESTFKKLAPSRNRYTLLRDEL